ncbi:MAG: NAD(+) synthase [Muribaculaceae bacterium]
MSYGFVRVAAAIASVNVADCQYNTNNIIGQCAEASERGVKILAFPELCITAYSCGDLFGQSVLLDATEHALMMICNASRGWDMLVIVGAPLRSGNNLYNCAVAIEKGKFLGVVPKTFLPNYNEFYEKRWFTSAYKSTSSVINICGTEVPFGSDILFVHGDVKVAIEICEDLWTPIPPSSYAAIAGANVVVNISASNEVLGKHDYLLNLIRQQSGRCMSAYIYSSAGYGESTTDLVFAGNAIIAENGTLLQESKRFDIKAQMMVCDIDVERLNNERRTVNSFSERTVGAYREIHFDANLHDDTKHLERTISPHPFVPSVDEILASHCEEIINIQTQGLMRRLSFTHCERVVVGVSGGLDSTLALLVAVNAFDKLCLDRKGIYGITMPGFGTSDRTYHNAINLIDELGVTFKEISIKNAVEQHFKDINHDINVHDVTYENSQARERTQVLMDFANGCGGMVLGTGDLSELALGWATYNGDHMSMYGVNASVPKTLIRHIVKWHALHSLSAKCQETLLDVIDTPISPELIPADAQGNINQKTEDLVGPYELHDFFLFYMLRYGFAPRKIFFLARHAFCETYDDATIKKWLCIFYRRFFTQQFKRSCLPDGPKVGSIGLSPRGDWRMPSDASATLWLTECDIL